MTNKTTRNLIALLAIFPLVSCVNITITVPASEWISETRSKTKHEIVERLQNPKAEKPIVLEKVDPCDACVEQIRRHAPAPLNEGFDK